MGNEDRIHTLFGLYSEDISNKLSRAIEFSDLIGGIEEDLRDVCIGEAGYASTNVVRLELKTNEIQFISNGSVLVPFWAEIVSTIESVAGESSVLSIETQRLKEINKEINESGNYDLREPRKSVVRGHSSVAFEDTDPAIWKREKQSDKFWAEAEIRQITVFLEDIRLAT